MPFRINCLGKVPGNGLKKRPGPCPRSRSLETKAAAGRAIAAQTGRGGHQGAEYSTLELEPKWLRLEGGNGERGPKNKFLNSDEVTRGFNKPHGMDLDLVYRAEKSVPIELGLGRGISQAPPGPV